VLRTVLDTVLRLLHPIVPFITSEIFGALGHREQLGRAPWPSSQPQRIDARAEADFGILQGAVGAIRALRAEAEVPPTQAVRVFAQGAQAGVLTAEAEVLEALARATLLKEPAAGASLAQVLPDLELRLPFEGLIDADDWRGRQRQRLSRLERDCERARAKLDNERFTANAPAEVVAEQRRRLQEAQDVMARIREVLRRLDATNG
jgi:valyl-tRNA synthetase